MYNHINVIEEANLLLKEDRLDEALKYLKLTKTRFRNSAEICYNLGCIYLQKKEFLLAINEFEEAVKIDNSVTDYNINLVISCIKMVNILMSKKNYISSIKYLKKIEKILLKFKNNDLLCELYMKLASCYQYINDVENVRINHEKLYKLSKKPAISAGLLCQSKLFCADWKDINNLLKKASSHLSKGFFSITPFTTILTSNNPKIQFLASKNFSNHFFKNQNIENYIQFKKKNIKPNIAFLSSDFHDHATSHLIAGFFEYLNQNKFNYSIFSYGNIVDDSEVSKKIRKSIKKFHNVSEKTDQEIANMLIDNKVDIAVDLKGHTKGNRLKILSSKPCPVQISYLGYPGTLGTNFIDYLIFDEYVVTKTNRKYLSEKVIYLPNCYQCNDFSKTKQPKISRSELNLPEKSFIFSCINNPIKINDKMVKAWSRILNKTDNSILWILDYNIYFKKNLLIAFSKYAVDLKKIIFAPRVSYDKHINRLRQADLFLDTYPCNAHTTAVEHIWSEVPVLTLSGKTIASRVAGSINKHIGLSEMICKTYDEYEKKAIFLASNQELLIEVKNKIRRNKKSMTLFNTKLFANSIEKAFSRVLENFRTKKQDKDIFI